MGGVETTQLIPWLEVPGDDFPRVIGHFNFFPLTPDPARPRGGAPWDELVEPGELFDLRQDLSERRNLYGERPEIVRELKGLLAKYQRDGRSTPGAAQKNDVPIGSGKAKRGD